MCKIEQCGGLVINPDKLLLDTNLDVRRLSSSHLRQLNNILSIIIIRVAVVLI